MGILEERVSRGASLLDLVRPGWEAEIDLGSLAMEFCDLCILGQLWGEFRRGFRELVKPLPSSHSFSAASHGFTLHELEQVGPPEVILPRFHILSDVWRSEIRRRLAPWGEGSEVIADRPAETLVGFDRHGIFLGRADRIWPDGTWRVRVARLLEAMVCSEADARSVLMSHGAREIRTERGPV